MVRKGQPSSVLRLGDLVLDRERREVVVNGKARHLTPKECQLLATFMQHPGEVLTRKYLMREVWETDFCEDTRTIEVHVSWLRRKLNDGASCAHRIQAVRGVGYMFMPEG